MKADIRKNQIMHIAKAVFARHGYHKTNIAMICSQAGIGRGTLYQYFKNKYDVFEALVGSILDQIKEVLAYTLDPYIRKDQYIDFQRKRLGMIFKLFYSERDFARVAFRVSNEFPILREQIDRLIIVSMTQEMDIARKMGFLRPDIDPEIAATKISGGLEKIIMNYLLDRKKIANQQQIYDLIDNFLSIEFYGILSQGSLDVPWPV